MEIFHALSLLARHGKILRACFTPVCWILAFILLTAIPDFFGPSNLMAAVYFLQFTYSFPPMIAFGFLIQKNAKQEGKGFDPATGQAIYYDHGIKRCVRSFFTKQWYINVWHVIYACGTLAVSGLGTYAAVEALISAFQDSQINAFSCRPPLDLSP